MRGGIEWCLRGASRVVEIFVRVASTASGGEEAGGGFFRDFECIRARFAVRTAPKSIIPGDESRDAATVPLRVVVVEDADHMKQVRVPFFKRHVRRQFTS